MDWLSDVKGVLTSRTFASVAGAVVGGVVGGVATGGAGVIPAAVAGASAGGALHDLAAGDVEPAAAPAAELPALKVAYLEDGRLLAFSGTGFIFDRVPLDAVVLKGDVPIIHQGERSFEPKWRRV